MALTKYRRQVLLTVVDLADWEGSFPLETVRSLLAAREPPQDQGRDGSRPNTEFSWILAANKADLLPVQRVHTEAWIRGRLAAAGLPRPASVAVVSSYRGWGVASLLSKLQRTVGTRGDVYVVGAQNAGKSSLVNAMRGAAGLSRDHDVTAASVPGTTLGLLRVPGLLPTGCKMLDTPGIPASGSVAELLAGDELRLLQARRPYRPRTYRLGPGSSALIGGLARVDVLFQDRGSSLYLTVWTSDAVACYMGKTAGVDEKRARHLGERLAPPLRDPPAFPKLRQQHVVVDGGDWRRSSRDIAVAGLGWIGVAISGRAELAVWVPEGVNVTVRDALARELAPQLEHRGFGVAVGAAPGAPVPAEKRNKKGAANKSRRAREGGEEAAPGSATIPDVVGDAPTA